MNPWLAWLIGAVMGLVAGFVFFILNTEIRYKQEMRAFLKEGKRRNK